MRFSNSRADQAATNNSSAFENPELFLHQATPADRFAIAQFFQETGVKIRPENYHWQQDRPNYQFGEHLLCSEITGNLQGHLHLQSRLINWFDSQLNVLEVDQLTTSTKPDIAKKINKALLDQVDHFLETEDYSFAICRTARPQALLDHGWIQLGHVAQEIKIIDLLTALNVAEKQLEPNSCLPQPKRKISVRLWRQVEANAVQAIYLHQAKLSPGSTCRSDAHWHWLFNRRAYDQIYIAIEGGNKLAFDGDMNRVLGYAVMQDSQLIELHSIDNDLQTSITLLQRICGDALENDQRSLSIDLPPQSCLQSIISQVTNQLLERKSGTQETLLVRVIDPIQWLAESTELFYSAAKDNNLEIPCDLGMEIDGNKYSLHFQKQKVTLQDGKLGRSFLRMSTSVLVRILLGDLSFQSALKQDLVSASTQVASRSVEKISQKPFFWYPRWDNLRVF